MPQYFQSQKWWNNQTVFIVGGGPSLRSVDLALLEDRHVIAVNNSYQLLPKAEVIFFGDARWWNWHGKDIPDDYPGRIITIAGARYVNSRVCRMGREFQLPLSDDPKYLSGWDSGYAAINLAYLAGASRIVLLGFDMGFTNGEAHWHEDHPEQTPESNYTNLFAPMYPGLVEALEKTGTQILLATASKLSCIKRVELVEAVGYPDVKRKIV